MNHDIIVIGTSAGGVEVLLTLVGQLRDDLPASVFIVQHVSAQARGYLAELLDKAGPLPVTVAKNGETFQIGHIYVAPSDYHLLVKLGHLRTTRGPRENRVRPAIDPLFRSAAVSYGSRVIGVLLTGLQDDGAAGLQAIKQCGGITIVQDPKDAPYPEMPANALAHVEVDHCLPLVKLGGMLDRLAREPAPDSPPVPKDIIAEVKIAESDMTNTDIEDELGKRAPFSCPECSGPLWEMHDNDVRRYRCQVGHAYTALTLLTSQDETVESALWAAVRAMEERAKLLENMGRDARGRGHERSAAPFEERAAESRTHATRIRKLLLEGM